MNCCGYHDGTTSSINSMTKCQSALCNLASLERQRQSLDARTTATALEARAAGASWGDIGRMLGMTKQAARKRYDRRLPGM